MNTVIQEKCWNCGTEYTLERRFCPKCKVDGNGHVKACEKAPLPYTPTRCQNKREHY